MFLRTDNQLATCDCHFMLSEQEKNNELEWHHCMRYTRACVLFSVCVCVYERLCVCAYVCMFVCICVKYQQLGHSNMVDMFTIHTAHVHRIVTNTCTCSAHSLTDSSSFELSDRLEMSNSEISEFSNTMHFCFVCALVCGSFVMCLICIQTK